MRQFEFLEQMAQQMKDELPAIKPCPFCGNPYTDMEGFKSVTVVCHRCKAEGPSIVSKEPYGAIREAIARWNERA